MANIMEYLDWRGDLSFEEGAFNEVDNLCFSYLSYVDLDDVVPGIDSEECISIKEANEKYWEKYTEEEVKARKIYTKHSAFLMKKMAESVRFKDVKLSKFVNKVDEDLTKQFSAVVINYADDKIYVAFRGTDSTIAGWREDFNMSFQTVPAQKEAVSYLDSVADLFQGEIIAGGHSKGGNLAVFAAMNIKQENRDKLTRIYNNDGPGLIGLVLQNDSYNEIKGRIETFIPKSSIVGLLLEHTEDYKIVDSTERGLLSHDPLSWVIKGGHFELVDSPTVEGLIADTATRAWVESMDYIQREEFTNALFGALEEAGIHTTSDFTKDRWHKAISIVKTLKDNPDDLERLLSAGKTIIGGATKAMIKILDDFIDPSKK